MESYQLGHKAIKRLVIDEDAFAFYKAKLSLSLFQTEGERAIYAYTAHHAAKFHALPKVETLESEFPELKEVACPEPAAYYLDKLEKRYCYGLINDTNLETQTILKADNDDVETAIARMKSALDKIALQRYRAKILDFGVEGPSLLLAAYKNELTSANPPAYFGWKALDVDGPCAPGEVASMVGRMAMGKTFFVLHTALHNWHARKRNVLFVSMEMAVLPIAQRAGAMYAHTNLTQLKTGGYSFITFPKFKEGLKGIANEDAKFYIVDGNLAASVEDIYTLAVQLKVNVVVIDGAYLTRHPTIRDRFQRIAENAELMKRFTSELELPTIASWQFNREAAKKQKGKAKLAGDKVGLEDVGGSDVIPQISGILLGLFQEDGVETIQSRLVDIMKGRDGQVGQFRVKWDFANMDFSQIDNNPSPDAELSYL